MEYNSIKINEVVVHASPGSNIGDCIREAWALAIERWNNVILIHNSKRYKINVNDIYAITKEEKIGD
jgi:hypothetical protein